jgi:glycosyltransferase involved in cell wall biosynthesis
VVHTLVEGLIARGHTVSLMASADSSTSAELIPIVEQGLCDCTPPISAFREREIQFMISIAKILRATRGRQFDIIHNHLGWRLLPFESSFDCPLLTTLQIPLGERRRQRLWEQCRNAPIVVVSEQQKIEGLNIVATIHNGIDSSLYRFSPKGDGYLMFLGRVAPEKGIKEAIYIARQLKKRLVIAAAIHQWEEDFFLEHVRPELDDLIQFVGEVDDRKKNDLLGNADALLNPVQWDEPFGLVCAESLACGTPIVTLSRGAMPEIVTDSVTGIVARSVADIICRFPEVEKIDRKTCRQRAVSHFSADLMVSRYEQLYGRMRLSTSNKCQF